MGRDPGRVGAPTPEMNKHLLIVESPAKARTIKKYLGPGFEVLASYGHVRDLRPKSGAVDPEHDFKMHYALIEKNTKHVEAIVKAARKSDALYLATDLDREGEAISWHLREILADRKALDDKPVRRIVFHEITKQAIEDAVQHPRAISQELVDAQQARRALDYLVGFNLSPLLWKKVQRGLSAGRVQSPALRLICEREEEISRFEKREYWTIEAAMNHAGAGFPARLTTYRGEKLQQFSFVDENTAAAARAEIEARSGGTATVAGVEKRQRRRQPAAPFITSTLQQEGVRRLGFTAQRTMRVAQQLYEGVEVGSETVGLVTYMRTDSVTLANEALSEIRAYVEKRYGADQLPEQPRVYKTRAKNAQEAHEAIRPTSIHRTPEAIRQYLSDEQYKLYDLIWRRTVACQMVPALIDTVAVDLSCGEGNLLRATGSTIARSGFLAVYEEARDEPGEEPESGTLPPLATGDRVEIARIEESQHFTEPPPRYSEATLVKALEDFGIGRPSTYAAIISTLQQRGYAALENKRFRPSDIGMIVNRFLTEHFGNYVDYAFTANLEDRLDAISRGERDWKAVLSEFWAPFRDLVRDKDSNVSRGEVAQSRDLGLHPKTAEPVSVRMGRYGPFVQFGSAEGETKPRFYSLRPGQRMEDVTLDHALELEKLPRDLGLTPEDEPLTVNVGRFGPYVRYGSKYVSLAKTDDPYTITRERALELVAAKKQADSERHIAEFDGGRLKVLKGRFGPYVTDGKRNARIPKDQEPTQITQADAEALLAAAPVKRRPAGAGRRTRKSESVEA